MWWFLVWIPYIWWFLWWFIHVLWHGVCHMIFLQLFLLKLSIKVTNLQQKIKSQGRSPRVFCMFSPKVFGLWAETRGRGEFFTCHRTANILMDCMDWSIDLEWFGDSRPGKLTICELENQWKSPWFSWVNPLFLWSFSIFFCMFTRQGIYWFFNFLSRLQFRQTSSSSWCWYQTWPN